MKRAPASVAADVDPEPFDADGDGASAVGAPGEPPARPQEEQKRRRLLRRRSSASASHPEYPPGPQDLRSVLRRSVDAVDDLLTHCACDEVAGEQLRRGLQAATSAGVVVTAAFAGTGCFEASARQVFDTLARRLEAPARFVTWASWERCPTARRVLLAEGEAGPSGSDASGHVFGDLLDRLFDADRQTLLEIEEKCLQSFKDLKSRRASGALSAAAFADEASALSETFISSVRHVLERVEFRQEAWCYRHCKRCPITPRGDPQIRRMIWADGSGSICCPWSAMGGRSMWLDPASLAFFVWAYSSRYYEPDVIVHECVVGFPEQALVDVFGPPPPGSAPLMKCPWARPPGNHGDGYLVKSQVWSPADIGVPSNRPRKYTSLHLIGSLENSLLQPLDMADVFYRSLQVDASVYICAPASQQALEVSGTRAASAVGVTSSSGSPRDPLSADSLLSAADCSRMEGYIILAERRGCQGTTEPPPGAPHVNCGLQEESGGGGRAVRPTTSFSSCRSPHAQTSWMSPPGLFFPAHATRTAPTPLPPPQFRGFCSARTDGQRQWESEVAIANVTQSAGFSAIQRCIMPTLLRRSKLVDLVRRRVISASEHWVIQGFPHPSFGAVDTEMGRYFPCPRLVGAGGSTGGRVGEDRVRLLSPTEQRALTGNSMHWAQVGVWFLCTLAQQWRRELDPP